MLVEELLMIINVSRKNLSRPTEDQPKLCRRAIIIPKQVYKPK